MCLYIFKTQVYHYLASGNLFSGTLIFCFLENTELINNFAKLYVCRRELPSTGLHTVCSWSVATTETRSALGVTPTLESNNIYTRVCSLWPSTAHQPSGKVVIGLHPASTFLPSVRLYLTPTVISISRSVLSDSLYFSPVTVPAKLSFILFIVLKQDSLIQVFCTGDKCASEKHVVTRINKSINERFINQ